MGLRWAGRQASLDSSEMPAPRWGLSLLSKAALDEFFFATELVLATFVSGRERERVGREVIEAGELYRERGWLADPRRFHRSPPPLENARVEKARRFVAPSAYRHLRFESSYEPHAEEPGRERWLGYRANRTAHAWLLEHPGGPRPWVVCVPGYRMGHPIVDFAGFRTRWLHRGLGLNVAIPVMPLHGPRRVGRRGGDGFFSGDFLDTIHAQAQAVWDVRRLIGWLRGRHATAVAAQGVSLGGYTTALLACLEPDLDCVIVGVPAADFLQLLRSNAPPVLLRAVARLGFSLDDIERVLRVISPLAMPPRVPRKRLYLYAGLADRLASPDHAMALWNHWKKPRVAWYQGSHVSYLWEKDVKVLLEEALTDCGLIQS
jgi:hypothetical protein